MVSSLVRGSPTPGGGWLAHAGGSLAGGSHAGGSLADGALAGGSLAHGDGRGAPTLAGMLFSVHLSWLVVVLVAVAAVYLAGVYRLRLRGDRWPAGRVVCFLLPGLGSIAAVTVTGLAEYDTTLLSVHMVQHMMLSMVAPIFLALGAPVTLALRTLPHRPRSALLAVVHSRAVRVATFPLVSFALFVVTPFVLYFTDLYAVTMRHELVHELVHLHFVAVGCAFFWPLIGVDPLPGRWPYPARALLMFLATPFHTVLGLTVMQSTTLLGGDWYPSLRLGWADPFTDQRLAGGILWAGGELVSVTMLAVLVVQWMRYSDREARRLDRQLDREEELGHGWDQAVADLSRSRGGYDPRQPEHVRGAQPD